jgi:NAD(P)-dependent dehydrogenase (short-subunit alcohol dehydrogenase family)
MDQLEGKVAVVTGAASGIGLAMAEAFAAEGMKIVMADIEPEALSIAAEGLKGKASAVLASRTDVSNPDSVEELAAKVYDAFGATHVLCNNAGVEVIGAVHEHTLADWQWVMGVNLWGVIHGVRSFVPRMLAQGSRAHIVNTASMAGLVAAPFMSVYDVTKFGVTALSESMYKEFGATNADIGVSVLCPGLINTNIMSSRRNRQSEFEGEGEYGAMALAFRQQLTAGLAAGYPPSEVAAQVLDAVKTDRFYVVPAQDSVKAGIKARADDLIELRNPRR